MSCYQVSEPRWRKSHDSPHQCPLIPPGPSATLSCKSGQCSSFPSLQLLSRPLTASLRSWAQPQLLPSADRLSLLCRKVTASAGAPAHFLVHSQPLRLGLAPLAPYPHPKKERLAIMNAMLTLGSVHGLPGDSCRLPPLPVSPICRDNILPPCRTMMCPTLSPVLVFLPRFHVSTPSTLLLWAVRLRCA